MDNIYGLEMRVCIEGNVFGNRDGEFGLNVKRKLFSLICAKSSVLLIYSV